MAGYPDLDRKPEVIKNEILPGNFDFENVRSGASLITGAVFTSLNFIHN
jgi:hypothetical protein